MASLPKHDPDTRYKHFTFVIQDDVLIDWATNRCVDPFLIGYDSAYQTVHSEVLAYRRARGLLDKSKGFEMLNIRFNGQSELKCSKPCSTCLMYLKKTNLKKIFFSENNGKFSMISPNNII